MARLASLVIVLVGNLLTRSYAQAPPLLWTTNIAAQIFAVDEQTNVYANAGGAVIKLNPAGAVLQSNNICPLSGLAQRDGAGSYYFAGSFDGTQNFGGITLVGGFIFNGSWHPGYPDIFVAKYTSEGTLVWAQKYGSNGLSDTATDVQLTADGGLFVGDLQYTDAYVLRFNNAGSNAWAKQVGSGFTTQNYAIRLGGLTETNCCFLRYNSQYLTGFRIDFLGMTSGVYPAYPNLLIWQTSNSFYAKAVIDSQANAFVTGLCTADDTSCYNTPVLRKCSPSGAVLWSQHLGSEEQWTLATDLQDNVYLGGVSNLVAKYDPDGTLIWSGNYGQKCIGMLVDSAGNRFVSFANGSVGRLGADLPPQLPQIITNPVPQTVFVGSNVTLMVTVSGTPPLRYFWRQEGTNVINATNATLNFSSATASNSGMYSVVVTNLAGSVTSSTALLRVKSVELYVGSQLLTNGTYLFDSPPSMTIRSAFANGSAFYTLDGSTPSFSSTHYSGPFTLTQSATVRAIGYSADFFQSEEADAVNAIVLVNHTVKATSSGGGTVSLNPPGGTYVSTNMVTATATPAAGWSFLYWLGDATGSNPMVTLSMNQDRNIYAAFGTTLSTTVAGNGQVVLSPSGGLYRYGLVVRLTGVPQPGNYFGFWGNAATGNTNPLYFTISSPQPTVSSVFGVLSSGQATLTMQIAGNGRVDVSPRTNQYALNQSVTLTAIPDAGQSFLSWTGDASGTQNPLIISMTQSKLITANFSSRPLLSLSKPGVDGLSPAGFRFTVVSDFPQVWQIFGTTNLSAWDFLGKVTNSAGEVQFLDSGALNLSDRFYKATP